MKNTWLAIIVICIAGQSLAVAQDLTNAALALTVQDLRTLPQLTDADLASFLEELEATPVLTAEAAPKAGTFYSLQHPEWPPLPMNVSGVDLWSLANGGYLLNDLDVSYGLTLAKGSSAVSTSSARAMSLDFPSPGEGGTNSGGVISYSLMPSPDYGTNLWLSIESVSGNNINLTLHNTAGLTEYELLGRETLDGTNWESRGFVLGADGATSTVAAVAFALPGDSYFLRARSGASSDGSGLPDWWEAAYGVSDPYGDPDGDGWNNLQEYQNGTNPNVFDMPPVPHNLTLQVDGTNATLSWQSGGGNVSQYKVEVAGRTIYVSGSQNNVTVTIGADYVGLDAAPPTFSVTAQYANGSSSATASIGMESTQSQILHLIPSPAGGCDLVTGRLPADAMTIILFRLTETNNDLAWIVYDVAVTNLVNGAYHLPPEAVAFFDSAFSVFGQVQTASGHLIWSGYVDRPAAPPFYDGREQLKQNLVFLLRQAASQPFNCAVLPEDYGAPTAVLTSPADYVYAGFYGYDLQFTTLPLIFDALQPFKENYLYHNFVFATTNVNTDGGMLTGAGAARLFWWGMAGNVTAQTLQSPAMFEFTDTMTNWPSIPAQLSANDTQWLCGDPSGIQWNGDDLGAIGITYTIDDDLGIIYTLNSDALNYWGLPIQSVKIAWEEYDNHYNSTGNLATHTLLPGGSFTIWGDNLYLAAAQPQFQTMEYDFWRRDTDLLPGALDFSPTNISRMLFTTPGSLLNIAAYAKLAVTNGYPGVYAYLGQYFDRACLMTNGVATANATGILSPYGSFFATEPGTVALVTMPDVDTGERGTGVVHVVGLQLDANHDGTMDTSFAGPDATSPDNPFTFWVNNDNDGSDYSTGQEMNAPHFPDCQDNEIKTERDLEDFARLWVCGLSAVPTNQGYTVTMSLSGGAINLYSSYESNGGIGYLTNDTVAMAQITTDKRFALARLSPGNDYVFPAGYFATGEKRCFLFEGAAAGGGWLTLTVYQGTNALVQTSAYLDLHDVKDLYEQAHVANVTTTYPAMVNSPTTSTFVSDHQLPDSATDPKQMIVFVHGWRMGMWDYQSFSDSMFKRLYWAGYQGRFAALRWPTLSRDDFKVVSELQSYTTFNRSEHIAFDSGAGASAYFDWLKSRLPDYSLNVAAHSMGNIVMMEALKDQLAAGHHAIDNYVMMQAAVTAQCYDTNLANYSLFTAAESASHTPDVYRGYPGDINGALNGNMVNFFNTNDYALATGTFLAANVSWEHNQIDYKPDGFWFYHSDGTNCFQDTLGTTTVTNIFEKLAFVARPRAKAVGALGGVGGQVNGGEVDLRANYGFDTDSQDHSAEFNWTIQQLGGTVGFYKALQDKLFP